MMYLICKMVWQFLKNLNIELTCDPAIPLLGIYSKKSESETGTDICTPMFIAALIIIAKRWEQPKGLSTDGWINQMWYICMMELSFSLKKGKTFFNMLNMNEHIC